MAHSPSSSRSLPWLAGAAALLVLLAAAWWVLGTGEIAGQGGSRPVTASPRSDDDATLPAALEGDTQARPLEGDAAGASAALAEAADVERVVVHGRLLMADGGALPGGVLLSASVRPPPPRTRGPHLTSEEWFPYVPGTTPRRLREQTRTAPGEDGRFTMENVPATGAWLQVEHELLYCEPVSLRAGEEAVAVLLHGTCIEGRVLDVDRRPVAGAEVTASSDFDPFAILSEGITLIELDDVETDAEGRFVLGQVPPDIALTVRASTDAHAPASVSLSGLPPGRRERVELVLLPGASIAGLVLDEHDQPVARAQVRLEPSKVSMGDAGRLQDRLSLRKSTDEAGRFVYAGLSPGSYRLVLTAAGYRPVYGEPFEVLPGEARDDLLLRAERGLSVSGQVVDGDGAPLPGADVTAFLPPSLLSMRANMDRAHRHHVETDEQGRFELHGYDEGPLRVRAEADAFVPAQVDATAGEQDVRLVLVRRSGISGVAVRLADAEPLTGYTLSFAPSGNLFDPTKMFEVGDRIAGLHAPLRVSDEQGRFSVEDVLPGSYDLTVSAEGFARTTLANVTVTAGQSVSGLVFLVPEEASVGGLVVSGRDGRALSGATVAPGRQDLLSRVSQMMLPGGGEGARTDVEGRFLLRGLPPGPLRLTVTHGDHASLALPEVAPRAGEQLDLGVLTLSPGASVWGEVRDADGRPVPATTVLVSSPTGQSFKRGVSDDDGRYEVWGLAPGRYQVMRMDFQFDLTRDNPNAAVDGMVVRTVELAADERKRVDLSPGDGSGTRLTGTVASKGAPEKEALLWLLPEEFEGRSLRTGRTDEQGRYEFAGLQPGGWLLQVLPSDEVAMGSGGQPVAPVVERVLVADVPVQVHDVEVPGGVLAGSVHERGSLSALPGVRVVLERTDGARPASALLAATGGRVGEGFTDAEGRFRFGHLAPGSYALVAGGSNLLGLGEAGWAATRVAGLTVHEGRSSPSVRVDLRPGGGVRGTLTGPGGEPLAGVAVWARDERSGAWLSTLSEVVSDEAGVFEVNSLTPGPWTFAFGGDAWALTLVGPRTVPEGDLLPLDVALERGVEVWIDVAPHDPAGLRGAAVGPQGELPLHLSSITGLLGASRKHGSRLRLGRITPGAYDLTVWSGTKVLFSAGRTVTRGDDPLVLTLEP